MLVCLAYRQLQRAARIEAGSPRIRVHSRFGFRSCLEDDGPFELEEDELAHGPACHCFNSMSQLSVIVCHSYLSQHVIAHPACSGCCDANARPTLERTIGSDRSIVNDSLPEQWLMLPNSADCVRFHHTHPKNSGHNM